MIGNIFCQLTPDHCFFEPIIESSKQKLSELDSSQLYLVAFFKKNNSYRNMVQDLESRAISYCQIL